MSQTETLLLVVLGFALATLVALFLGRLVWVTALRLGARRMHKQVPTTLVGLQTERDRLRAEHAMMSQRLGSRLEAVKLKMAEQMAEVSRHRNRLEMAEANIAAKSAEIERLNQHVRELETRLADQAGAKAALEAAVAEREQELADVRTKIDQLDDLATPVPVPTPVHGAADAGLQDRIAKLNQLALHVANEREVATGQDPQAPIDPLLTEKLEEARRQTHDIQKELERLDAEWSRKLEELPAAKDNGPPAQPRAVANVISLANRIRALQKDMGTT